MLILVVAIVQLVQSRGTGFGRRAATILGIVIVQAGLGIATILTGVPLWLALLHQFVASGCSATPSSTFAR